jgi:hypothetical protein
MFERSLECPRCKGQILLGFWDYSPVQGYAHVYCQHCGGESKFGLKARLAGAVAILLALVVVYLSSLLANSYVSLLVTVLSLPFLFAALCSPLVTLEPTNVGRKLQRLRPFFILMAVLCFGLAVMRLLGFRT